jgi:hypothetical protein
VFLSDDHVKLGDFGLSKDMGTSAFTDTYVGVSCTGPLWVDSTNGIDPIIYASGDLGREPL